MQYKISVVQVALNENCRTEDVFLQMLNTLLSPNKGFQEKKTELEEKFHIPMQESMEKELNIMCNLSEYVEEIGIEKGFKRGIEQGIEQGIAQGIEQGIEQGIAQGIEQGISRGIQALIEICGELKLCRADTLARVQKKFALPESRAERYMEQFWPGDRS